MVNEATLHATSVVFCGRGILLRGESGSGKSDLALRLIDAEGLLIADDRTVLAAEEGVLYASPPESIAGLLEIRGLGLYAVPYIEKAQIDLCLDCMPQEEIERMPEKAEVTLQGVTLPCFKIYPFEASSVAKIRALLQYSLTHD